MCSTECSTTIVSSVSGAWNHRLRRARLDPEPELEPEPEPRLEMELDRGAPAFRAVPDGRAVVVRGFTAIVAPLAPPVFEPLAL